MCKSTEYELIWYDAGVDSLDAVVEQTVGVATDHHERAAQRRVRVNGVPLDAVADEVVAVRSTLVVDAVEMGLEAAGEPPGASVVTRAVVIETRVVVAETSTQFMRLSCLTRPGV